MSRMGTESPHSAHSVFSYFLYIHSRTLRNERRNALEFLTIHVSNHLVDRQLLFLERNFFNNQCSLNQLANQQRREY